MDVSAQVGHVPRTDLGLDCAMIRCDVPHAQGATGAEAHGRALQHAAAGQLGAGFMVPAALREFYLALGNCGDLMETDHYVWDPEDLEVRDGFLMFLEDADETVVWGLPVDNLALPDPLVWRRSAGADAPEGEWQDEGGTFSEFLTDLLAWTFEDPEDDDEGLDR